MKNISALIIGMLLLGCASFRPGAQVEQSAIVQKTSAYTLGVVELDDQGWFYDRADVDHVLDTVKQEVAQNGATVVVFVHGWHHSGRAGDSNLTGFSNVLEEIHTMLERPLYKSVRELVIPGAKNRVVGVYVAWRGQSLPGVLDYATFGDRKAAADRVGHGDAAELFTRLAQIHRQYNDEKSFTTLVTLGHSFGAQVVFSAIADVLKARIAEGTITAVPRSTASSVPLQPLNGFGDLVLLVNPAHEASIYDSIHRLMRNQAFAREQAPILLTISSEADGPNRVLFPIGRRLGLKHQPHGSDEQYEQKTRSLGNYRPHITHCLFASTKAPCKGFPPPLIPPNTSPITDDTIITAQMLAAIRSEAPNLMLGSARQYGATSFYPVGPIDANNPFLVTKTTGDVVADHNAMFNANLREFVAEFVGLSELKRLVIPSARAARSR